jgi:hypothetical protein
MARRRVEDIRKARDAVKNRLGLLRDVRGLSRGRKKVNEPRESKKRVVVVEEKDKPKHVLAKQTCLQRP